MVRKCMSFPDLFCLAVVSVTNPANVPKARPNRTPTEGIRQMAPSTYATPKVQLDGPWRFPTLTEAEAMWFRGQALELSDENPYATHEPRPQYLYDERGLPSSELATISGMVVRAGAGAMRGDPNDERQATMSADPYEVWERPAGGYRYGSEHLVGALVDGFRIGADGAVRQRVHWTEAVLLVPSASDRQRQAAWHTPRKYASNAERQRAYRARRKAAAAAAAAAAAEAAEHAAAHIPDRLA